MKDGHDIRVITLREFLKQALLGRSCELEVLFCRQTDIIEIHPKWGAELLANRDKLISVRLLPAILGFYNGQKHRMAKGNGGRYDDVIGYDPKMAAHCIRAVWQAITLKKTNRLEIFVDDASTRELILRLKAKQLKLAEFYDYIREYDTILDNLSSDGLPKQPDYDWANEFLIGVGREEYCKV